MSSDQQLQPFTVGGYPATAYGWDGGSIEIDMSSGNGGWSGCGHSDSFEVTNDELTRMVNELDAAVIQHDLEQNR